jgi:hypothetical protein
MANITARTAAGTTVLLECYKWDARAEGGTTLRQASEMTQSTRSAASWHSAIQAQTSSSVLWMCRGWLQFLPFRGERERPVAIALRTADEEIVHAGMIAAGEGGFKPRIGRGGLSSRRL